MATELTFKSQPPIQGFVPQMLYHMREICKDHFERIQSINDTNLDVSKVNNILDKGFWYSNEYCQILQKFSKTTRLQWLIERGAPYHGFMPNSFTPIKDFSLPTGRKLDQYQIAKNVTPSAAMESIQNSFYLIDCGMARDIAVYRTLQDLLGKEKFDLLFASNSNTPLQLGTDDNPYRRLFNRVELRSAAALQPGDFCHFSNIQNYIAKHPFGPARGYNAICDENSQFLAMGLKPGSLTADVEKALLDGYNAPQDPETFFLPSIVSYAYGKTLLGNEARSRAFVESFKDHQLTKEKFEKMPNRAVFASVKAERRMLLSIERPNLDKIKMLVEAPLEKIGEVFSSLSFE